MPRDHEPHFNNRYHLWCGGTKPSTEVAVNIRGNSLTVDIFPEDADIHEQVVPPVKSREFLVPDHEFSGKPSDVPSSLIGNYALAALEERETDRGPETPPA